MKWWKRWPEDYRGATSDLSLAEHGAYTLLLDAAYLSETALSPDRVYRLAGAHTEEERAAVDTVLDRFWRRDPDGWRNPRVEAEIGVAQKARESGERGARKRWGDRVGHGVRHRVSDRVEHGVGDRVGGRVEGREGHGPNDGSGHGEHDMSDPNGQLSAPVDGPGPPSSESPISLTDSKDYQDQAGDENRVGHGVGDRVEGRVSGRVGHRTRARVPDAQTPRRPDSQTPRLPDAQTPRDLPTTSLPACRGSCAESSSAHLVITLPCAGKGHPEAEIGEGHVREWQDAYPGVDVPQQLRSMRQWLLHNPTRRKTSRGIGRFITNWLARAQDQGGGAVRSASRESPSEQMARLEREGKI